MRERYTQAIEEVERLRKQLGDANLSSEEASKQHASKMGRVMQANEALQKQLKDLNGVVEAGVSRELQRGGPATRGAKASKKGPKVAKGPGPPGVFTAP